MSWTGSTASTVLYSENSTRATTASRWRCDGAALRSKMRRTGILQSERPWPCTPSLQVRQTPQSRDRCGHVTALSFDQIQQFRRCATVGLALAVRVDGLQVVNGA